jgi:hypothetical protein
MDFNSSPFVINRNQSHLFGNQSHCFQSSQKQFVTIESCGRLFHISVKAFKNEKFEKEIFLFLYASEGFKP